MKARPGKIVARLRSISGHIQAIQRMVEEERPCLEVLRQVQAVQRALERVTELLLERHVQACVARAVPGERPGERERTVGEVMGVLHAVGALRGGNHGRR